MLNFVFLLGVFFVVSLQPVFMVSSLIVITLVYSYNIYNILGTFWFSYVLLMVMLSGVLVIFTYMITLVPNESFETYSLMMLFSFLFMMLLYFSDNFYMDMSMISVNLWISCMSMMSLLLVSYLLGIMLVVVVLSYLGDGAFHIK